MKLEVGMYVRTEDGIIAKCIYVNKEYAFGNIGYGFDRNVYKEHSNLSNYGVEKEIVKASFNIIDLIEAGDVLKIIYDNEEYICQVIDKGFKAIKVSSNLILSLGLVEIKSIVTKEQFQSIEYVIEKETDNHE